MGELSYMVVVGSEGGGGVRGEVEESGGVRVHGGVWGGRVGGWRRRVCAGWWCRTVEGSHVRVFSLQALQPPP